MAVQELSAAVMNLWTLSYWISFWRNFFTRFWVVHGLKLTHQEIVEYSSGYLSTSIFQMVLSSLKHKTTFFSPQRFIAGQRWRAWTSELDLSEMILPIQPGP